MRATGGPDGVSMMRVASVVEAKAGVVSGGAVSGVTVRLGFDIEFLFPGDFRGPPDWREVDPR